MERITIAHRSERSEDGNGPWAYLSVRINENGIVFEFGMLRLYAKGGGWSSVIMNGRT